MTNHARSSAVALLAPVLVAMINGAAAAGGPAIEVIYTKIPTDPSSLVPGALDLAGNPAVTNFRAFEDIYFSPDGTRWVLKGRTQQGADLETILLIGSGDTGTMFLQEGQPVPDGAAGELVDFFGSGGGRFNDNLAFAFSLRARGGSASLFQKVLVYTGGLTPNTADFSLVAHGGNTPFIGDLYTGLVDLPPNPSGDERIGNSIGSIHIQNNGTLGAQDGTINVIHSSRRPAIFYSAQAEGGHVTFRSFKQVGVSTFLDIDGITVHTYAPASGGLGSNTFYTTPDGAHWIVEAQIQGGATDSNDVLVLDGQARVREGSAIGTSSVVAHSILNSRILGNGDWIARGARRIAAVANGVWAARNGEIIAQTGDSISSFQGTEAWGASFQAVNGNVKGDWVITGKTNSADLAADDVLVLNGTVLVREGDPVDLDGNGQFDDNVFIGRGNNTLVAFDADDLVITEDGVIYFIANLRDGQGNDLNSNPSFGSPHAFLRISVGGPPPCPADITGDQTVNVNDLLQVINNWGPCPKPCPPNCAADITGDCTVNVNDLLQVINNWGPCPAELRACCFGDTTCQNLSQVDCTNAGGTWQGPGSDCGNFSCPLEPISEAWAISFMESVMNGPLARFGYSVTGTSEIVTGSSVTPNLTTVSADLTFTVRHEDGQIYVMTGSGTITIDRPTPSQHLLSVNYSLDHASIDFDGSYGGQHDLAAGTLDEQVSATILDGFGPQSYSVNKNGSIQSSLKGTTTTMSASVDHNGVVSNATVIDERVIVNPSTATRNFTMTSGTPGAVGSSVALTATMTETFDAMDQMTAQITSYELDRNGVHLSLQSPGSIATTRVNDSQYGIAYQLSLTDGGTINVNVSLNGMQIAIEQAGLTNQNKGWSWKEFGKNIAVGAGGGAAGGAVVGCIATDAAAPIGAGAGAAIGAVGGAVGGAATYTLGKAWDWAFGNFQPGPTNFQHDCDFGGIVEAHQSAGATVSGP